LRLFFLAIRQRLGKEATEGTEATGQKDVERGRRETAGLPAFFPSVFLCDLCALCG
jgi:hypothetical protein